MEKKYLILCFGLILRLNSLSQDFNDAIEEYVSKLKLPVAAIGIAQADSLIYFKSVGINQNIEIGPDHIFGIASLTKTMSAVTLQKAVGKGKISWDDKIGNFPNKYFNINRWDSATTLGHLFSMTSEGNPKGKNFVYNGSKFNLPFNVFQTLNEADTKKDMTARFTYEIDQTILNQLHMNHTLNRYDSIQIAEIGDKLVNPYQFDEKNGTYSLQDFNVKLINSGPAFGMMSSVNDLVNYSVALDNNLILSKEEFSQIVKPYYPGSPYGLGWFTCKIEGLDAYWAYGYGFNDASILLKIPAKKLTLIFLSACTMPSASTRMGYGNPLNSLVVISFIKNYILGINPKDSVHYDRDYKSIAINVKALNKKYKTMIFTDELYAKASLDILLPEKLKSNEEKAELLLALYLQIINKNIDIKNPLIFELIERCKSNELFKFRKKLIQKYSKCDFFHPSTAYFAGKICEQNGDLNEAIKFFRTVADDDFYKENGDKFSSMMWLAKYYQKNNKNLAKNYLERIILYKENISVFDDQYQEAKKMLEL